MTVDPTKADRASLEGDLVEVTCAPETIWPLEEGERARAVIELVSKYADLFADAVNKDDPAVAQEAVHAALSSFAGLFPDPNDNAHLLLGSLNSLLIQARQGQKRKHILSRPGAFTKGLKKGTAHAQIAAFAIAASKLLLAWEAYSSETQVYGAVAAMIAQQSISLKSDDHGQPKPISRDAVRDWVTGETEYPYQHAVAARLLRIHTQNIINRDIGEAGDLIAYLTEQARIAVMEAAAHQSTAEE